MASVYVPGSCGLTPYKIAVANFPANRAANVPSTVPAASTTAVRRMNEAEDVISACPDRDANADFPRPARHRVSYSTVDANRRENHGQESEDAQDRRGKSRGGQRQRQMIFERGDIIERHR